jgi:hypothetical protein
MTEQQPRYPSILYHKHGLYDWSPMLAERSAEVIVPGEAPPERFYRCQKVGCDAVVRATAEGVPGKTG